MEPIKLSVESRSGSGSSIAGRLRRDGKVPAVVYTSGRPAKQLVVSARDYQNLISKAVSTQFFDFESTDSELNGVLALVRDVQLEPTRADVQHIDFLEIESGNKIKMSVPVELEGESPLIKQGVGVLSQSIQEVEIECLPKDTPSSVKLDISVLVEPGQSLNVASLVLPEGVALRTDGQVNVVTVVAKQAAEEAPKEEAAPAGDVAPAEGGEQPKEEPKE